MIKLLRNIKTDKSGASAAEYALMIALVGGLIIVAASTLGGTIKATFNAMNGQIATANTKIGQ